MLWGQYREVENLNGVILKCSVCLKTLEANITQGQLLKSQRPTANSVKLRREFCLKV